MDRQLIFTNLGIDLHWDKNRTLNRIFPVRVPNSEHLLLSQMNMGIFLGNSRDLTVMHQGFDSTYLDFLNSVKPIPNVIITESNPFDESHWFKEFQSLFTNPNEINSYLFAGVSSLEEKILKLLPSTAKSNEIYSASLSSHEYKKMNNKMFLLQISKELNLEIPETYVFKTHELVNSLNFNFKKNPKILKFSQSSGGAGQFRLTDDKSKKVIGFLNRFDEDAAEMEWLVQDFKKSHFETTTYCWVENNTHQINHFNVVYDKNGYSNLHSTEVHKTQKEHLHQIADKFFGYFQGLNYHGPFGFDCLWDENHKCYIIDLNIRLNKGHLIKKAANFFDLEDFECHRLRFQGAPIKGFADFWDLFKKKSKHHAQVFPIEVAGLKPSESQKLQQLEISYLIPVQKNDKDWNQTITEDIMSSVIEDI